MTESPGKATASERASTFPGPAAEGLAYNGSGPYLSPRAGTACSVEQPTGTGLGSPAAAFPQPDRHSPTLLPLPNLQAGFGQVPCLHLLSAQRHLWASCCPAPQRWDPGSVTLLIHPSIGVTTHLAPDLPGAASPNRLQRLHPHR